MRACSSLLLVFVVGCASNSEAHPRESFQCGGTGRDHRELALELDVSGPSAEGGTETTLVVDSDVERAVILVDGEEVGVIRSGRATIQMTPGRHRLSIDADGYQRLDEVVTVQASTTMRARLH